MEIREQGEANHQALKAVVVPSPQHHHFVFVHGAMHGAWCWYKVSTLLESAGHKVSCLDLKGSGIDPSDPDTILKFSEYNQPLLNFMSNLPHDEKVILVGHSAGGPSVTHAIQEFGDKIHVAIYICASSLPVEVKCEPSYMWERGYGLGPDKPPTSTILKNEFLHERLYHMSPVEDITLASMLLRPFPAMAANNASSFHGDHMRGQMDKVKRVFIKTMQDRGLTPEVQDNFIQMWPPSMVLEIESDHSPFFSAPTQLINLLFQSIP